MNIFTRNPKRNPDEIGRLRALFKALCIHTGIVFLEIEEDRRYYNKDSRVFVRGHERYPEWVAAPQKPGPNGGPAHPATYKAFVVMRLLGGGYDLMKGAWISRTYPDGSAELVYDQRETIL